VSAEGEKFRNRPEEDLSTRRTAEGEFERGGDPDAARKDLRDKGVHATRTGDEAAGGSGTAGRGLENEGTGSLLVEEGREEPAAGQGGSGTSESERTGSGGSVFSEESKGSGSTRGGTEPGVSGRRGMTGGLEREGEGHSGPIRSGSKRDEQAGTQREEASPSEAFEGDASAGEPGENAREGYEDHGGSRDEDGTKGESSGSRPGYR
jgi:hypothetical protein